MNAVVTTFHIDWRLIVVQLINFAIVFFVLYRYALKPLAALMHDRKKTIQQGVTDAATNAELLEQMTALFEQEKIKAREEAQQLLQSMKKDIEEKRTAMLAVSHAQSEKILSETRQQLEQEKNAIITEAHNTIASLVVQSTQKIIASLPVDIQEKIIAQSIKEL